MSNRFAYHSRYLRVDLTSGASEFVELDESVLRRFIGGSGLGVYLLLKEGAAEVDPLSPAAALTFVFSPLVGGPLTTSAKFAVVSRSPLTGRINDSLASSGFAIAGKKSGADAIVIVGRARQPSVLIIDDGQVRIEAAAELWSAECTPAQDQLKQRYGGDYCSAVIGPAGERQVRFATISHDGRHAGRGGSGAVLGAKNLKAVVVRGTQRCAWARPAELIELAKAISKQSFGPATAKYRELGTAANLLVFNRLGALPTRNFQAGSFAAAVDLSPEALTVARGKTQGSCAACTIGCEHIYGINKDQGGNGGGVRMEYENLFALGPLCAVEDPDMVLRASQRCDQLGIDTISAGGVIAFAMECVERGLLDADWLRFGDGAAVLRAIDEIGAGQGLGARLALGSRALAEQIGGDSLEFAPQVKGLELPGYEPRALQTMALGFAVGARGADHNRSGAYEADFSEQADRRRVTKQSAAYAIATEDQAALMDSLILCKFLRGVFDDFFTQAAEMLRLTAGWDVDREELSMTARRIVTAKKLFNMRAGWTAAEDTLPERFFQSPLPEDAQARLSREGLQAAIAAYYETRGWSDQGLPESDLLRRLELADL